MIQYKMGDLFNENVEALVNPVNCVGIMGKGIAKTFKQKYPQMFEEYRKACQLNKVKIGEMFIVKENNKTIICFPTKTDWRLNSKIGYIQKGLYALNHEIVKHDIKSIAIPALGCGNGGLDWEYVKPFIDSHLLILSESVKIIVFEPIQ